MFSIQSILKHIFLSLITGALSVFLGLDIEKADKGERKDTLHSVLHETVTYPVSPTLPEELRTCISQEFETKI